MRGHGIAGTTRGSGRYRLSIRQSAAGGRLPDTFSLITWSGQLIPHQQAGQRAKSKIFRNNRSFLHSPQSSPAWISLPLVTAPSHQRIQRGAAGARENGYHIVYAFGSLIMTSHAVALRVTPCVRIECKFWLGDDGWNGSSEHPAVSVLASSFEQAKADMESALGKHIESLLERSRPVSKGQAA
jgi:predicted RNase H-like HicB family nuclease